MAGSLDLENLPFDSAIQKLEANWLSGVVGKKVFLKRGDKVEPVTLVRAADLLVQDAQGRYFNVRFEDLQFADAPPLNPTSPTQTLVYSLPKAGSGILSYLTSSVTWSPRYTLKASNSGAQLSALADIRNSTDLEYNVSKTELFAGDVSVQANPNVAMAEMAGAADFARSVSAPMAKIQNAGQLRGLQRYDLTSAFILPSKSVVTLPFLTPKLTSFERYVGLETYFDTGEREGNLNRYYRFKASERLPTGPIMVREDGRIVGQTSVPETRQGGQVGFTLGEDPEVSYTRSAQTLDQVKNKDGNVVKSTYKVTYSFESSKDQAIRAEITERVGGRVIIIDNATPVKNQGAANLKLDIPTKGKATKSFTVVVDNS